MENDDKRVEDIKKEIKHLKEDIDKIQSDCEHPEHKVLFDNESRTVIKRCSVCDKKTGFPTNDELKENGYL